MNPLDLGKGVWKGAKAGGILAGTAVAGGIAYSLFGVNHMVDLPLAIAAEQRHLPTDSVGRISYYVDDSATGVPLVLIHSINAAPSAHEMRPLFTHYRGQRPVYALDLPGFGFSERSRRRYTPQLFKQAILEFLRCELSAPADLVVLSLSSEFAAMAALVDPERVRSLTLISPTGLNATDVDVPEAAVYGLFSFPVWSQPIYDLLTSRASIQLFLGRNFVGEPPQQLLDYAYATSHQPGARFAPLDFLSGALFTKGVCTAVYEKLTQPTLIIYDEDPNVRFDRLADLLQQNRCVTAVRIQPTRGLPHWERLPETIAALEQHWASV